MSKSPRIISIEGNIGAGKSVLINEMRKYYNNQTKIYISFWKVHSVNIVIISIIYSLNINTQIKIITIYFCLIFTLYTLWNLYYQYNEIKKRPKIVFIEEPVDTWQSIKDNSGQNIIELYYTDKKKYGFVFQMMSLCTRLDLLNKYINEADDNTIIITERSIYTDAEVFESMLYNMYDINEIEHNVYNLWCSFCIKNLPDIEVIYLDSEPKNAFNRINKRSRSGEQNIELKYIEMCHNFHVNMILNLDENPLMVINIDNFNINSRALYSQMIESIFEKIYSTNK